MERIRWKDTGEYIPSEQIRQWYYRGSLKSCNYQCSYCPFSKRTSSEDMLNKDKMHLFRFVRYIEEHKDISGAVQIVPYGEALIHPYYWEALALISRYDRVEAVGAQTNLSFPVEEMLNLFVQQGGVLEKLRLWATFHPQMVSAEVFAKQCKTLSRRGVKYCVGTVGVPENLPEIKKMRQLLGEDVYLWINKMDGLGRNYTEAEIQEFLTIDEYFDMELTYHKADSALCGTSLFVEADGSIKGCNIAGKCIGNLYSEVIDKTDSICSRKECSCFMAYNNRRDDALVFFQPYPAFRIPAYPKAVFFDVDGTIVPEGQQEVPKQLCKKIKALSRHCDIYLATSLPVEEANRKTRGISSCIRGGVYANGGHCLILSAENAGYESVASIETAWITDAKDKQGKYGYKLHVYERKGEVYKVTFSFSKNRIKKEKDRTAFVQKIVDDVNVPKDCRWIMEKNCLQITRAGKGKLEGVLELIEVLGYGVSDILTIGNSENDIPMLEYFPHSIAVRDGRMKAFF